MRPLHLIGFGCVLTVAWAAPALGAPTQLDGQVNNDNSAGVGIDPSKDAGIADMVGGALTAGALEIPWTAFEQKTTGMQNIFVRAFKNGAWVTEGFPASLNINTSQEAQAPSIDFAGTGRTVPWVSWYEPNSNLSSGLPTQIFASRFAANAGSTGGGHWVPEGQDRAPTNAVPSLNINTDRTAENPAVAGGATGAGADPVPWVAWEENDGGSTDGSAIRQIFVSKGVKQATAGAACSTFKPSPNATTGVFCWQQVGADRLSRTATTSSSSGDPTLNVDPTRAGVEPDNAFTGPNDMVPWVVWYEKGNSSLPGFRPAGSEQIFAAKGVSDTPADGGFHWQAVGKGTAGQTNPLDTSSSPNNFGPCAASQAADDACSLNKAAAHNAENPRVASGTLTPGTATVPWVVWQEDDGSGNQQIFLAHLVGGDHFELFNGGAPLSNTLNNATRPDITFSNHEPYVSWHEAVAGVDKLFLAHFEGGAAAPTFHLDTPNGIAVSAAGLVPDQRAPISSTCTSTPFSSDGTSCRAGAAGTPFVLFTDGAMGAQKLFADAYAPSDVQTGDASSVTDTSATLSGSANPGGAPVKTGFDFGPSGTFASSIAGPLVAGSSAQPFGANLTGLSPSTAFDFRAAASSDFTTVTGPTKSFTTAAASGPPPPPPPPATKPPKSRIVGLPHKVKSKKLKRIHGTASDPDDAVARVDVAVTRTTGRAHAAAAARCLRLTSRGTLKSSRPKKGICAPLFLRASGTKSWKFVLKKRLRKGVYVVYSRATDAAGHREVRFTSANRKSVRVR